MTQSATLKICYAVASSLGDEAVDFVALPSSFQQVAAVVYIPRRTMQGAGQVIVVTGGAVGDKISWQASTSDCSTVVTTATSTRTATYLVSGTSQSLTLHTSAQSGNWTTCYLPVGGVWTALVGKGLEIIVKPTVDIAAAFAGIPTTITFTSSAKSGDFVALVPTVL